MTRQDSYVLKLERTKNNLRNQIFHCHKSFSCLNELKDDVNYTTAATQKEKDNIEELLTLIGGGLAALESIVWE